MKKRLDEKKPFDLIDEAFHILRNRPVRRLTAYYTGALPFILGLLFFWAEMSKSAFARQNCAAAAFGITILFIWMKCWQVFFTLNLNRELSAVKGDSWNKKQFFRMLVAQTFWHATGFIAIPLSLIFLIPFPWVYAFYQNLSVIHEPENAKIMEVYRRAAYQAKLWPLQNHFVLSVFILLALFVFLNTAISIFLFPQLLKKFFGIETIFTMSGISIFNTTFLAVTISLTYLFLDPVIKAVYTLRCFYGRSLRTGEDIKVEFRGEKIAKKSAAILVILACLIVVDFPGNTFATNAKTDKTTTGESVVSPKSLKKSIDSVMGRREFIWRTPKQIVEEETEKERNRFLGWIIDGLEKVFETLDDWIGKFFDWMDDLWPEFEPADAGGKIKMPATKKILYIIFGCLLLIIAVLLAKRLRSWKKEPEKTAAAVDIPRPDPGDESVRADEYPADEWMEMSEELMKKGQYRAAIRSIYLAILSWLSEKRLISVAKYKSNREYLVELQRKGHETDDICKLFSRLVHRFDRTWYGMYDVGPDDVRQFMTDRERIIRFVER